MLGWALPIRAGTSPAIVKAEAWLTRPASSEESRSTSTSWPFPVASRWRRAARMPTDGEEAGEDVDQGDADLLRLALGAAGDAHQPAERLHAAGRTRGAPPRRRLPKPVIEQ